MGIEQKIKLNNIEKDGQLIVNFDEDEIKKTIEPTIEPSNEDEITKRRKELDELYKDDPKHPEKWWQK